MEGGGGRGVGGERRAGRPPHVIAPDEVAAWLADSVNKVVTYHRTSRVAAQDITTYGVDIERSRGGAYGLGFYTATEDPGDFHGDTVVVVAVRTVRPIVGTMADVEQELDSLVDRLSGGTGRLTRRVAVALREALLQLGYDGLIVEDGGGDGVDYVVALEAHSVKVVA